jgi:hypothetical protein
MRQGGIDVAYQTGAATDMEDLLDKLSTFAQANGWTEDEFDTVNGKLALHKNSVYVSFRWDTATPQHLSVHQALGYTGGNEPGNHTDDSGNGYNTTSSHVDSNLAQERCVRDLDDGPFPSYFFFEQDASPAYLHVVAEKSTDVFRHFGFGELITVGDDWTGGEYAYGHYQINTSPISQLNTMLLDGLFLQSSPSYRQAATIHVEDLPGEGASSKWGQIWGATHTTPPDDTATNAKVNIQGGFRGGPVARQFGVIAAGSQSGLIPAYPIWLLYRNNSNNRCYWLGTMPDIRGLNIKNFAAKEEIVIGSDTWVMFPLAQKTDSAVTDRTFNSGVAYKKVTA